MADTEDQAVTNFIEFLRIKSVQPKPDYDGCVAFLKRQAAELELPVEVIECLPGKPVVIITWTGTDPSLKSLVLNSHTDVVPVYQEFWKHDPFAAVKEENGDIYARGTQDMKCVTIQYIEAIRRLKRDGQRFARTIHMTFVPDEEIGGKDGMMAYLETPHFDSLNLGFALDEGLANPNDAFTVFYGERAPWWVKVTCSGDPGHGSRFIENNAAEKLRRVMNSFLAYRDSQEQKLKSDATLRLGDVTTVNMTIISGGRPVQRDRLKNFRGLQGGCQSNVVPTDFSAVFDIRITPTQDLAEFEEMVTKWCSEAGKDVKCEFIQKLYDQTVTSISREDPWWNAFSGCMDKLGHSIETEIFPAATDSRFLRKKGYPAIGFSPMNNTPILLHDHNEFLNEHVFLRGIDVYYSLIPALANVPSNGK